MRQHRQRTGFWKHIFLGPLRRSHLSTSADPVDEIWSSLCYFADVPEVGRELLAARGVPADRLDAVFASLQSFLRQARTFYFAARQLHFRASPLIYYYAFLNLAKTLICLSKPTLVEGRIGHGLSHELRDGTLEQQIVSIRDGVFPLLYEIITGESVPLGTEADVLSILTFCTDIGLEIQTVKGKAPSTISALLRANIGPAGAFLTVASQRYDAFEADPVASARFLKYFEEVTIDKNIARTEFELLAEQASGGRFFESQVPLPPSASGSIPIDKLLKDCYDAIKPHFLEISYPREYSDFLLCRTLSNSSPVAFNEILAIYTAIYFLGSLVRYYPRFFEQTIAGRDVWMIEVFMRSAPGTLLRQLSNRIIGEHRIYTQP